MERVTQILTLLAGADGRPVSADEVLRVVPYGAGSVEDRRDQLRRDIRHLEYLGWEIANVAAPGETARYRLTAVDNRLRIEFTPAQRVELLRAAVAAGLLELVDDLGGQAPVEDDFEAAVRREDTSLARVQRGLAGRCRVRFRYRDRDRVVHPHALHVRPGGWYLTGNEDGEDAAKTFAVSRMTQVELDPPGSARVPAVVSRPQLDPVSWRLDPPVDALVQTTSEHRAQVESMLGAARTAVPHGGEALVLTIPVTHRAAFRRRLYELGTRVRLLGPPVVQEEVRQELEAVVRGEP